MDKRLEVFKENNFKVIKETVKGIQLANVETKEIVYLLPNKELTIVLNSNTVEGNPWLETKAHDLSHSTLLREFPQRKHTGKEPIFYGYSFKFQSTDELSSFLSELNSI